jgi:hypothetical protein
MYRYLFMCIILSASTLRTTQRTPIRPHICVILLTLPSAPLLLQACEGLRPDVTHLSFQLLPYPWFATRQAPLYPAVTFPPLPKHVSTHRHHVRNTPSTIPIHRWIQSLLLWVPSPLFLLTLPCLSLSHSRAMPPWCPQCLWPILATAPPPPRRPPPPAPSPVGCISIRCRSMTRT